MSNSLTRLQAAAAANLESKFCAKQRRRRPQAFAGTTRLGSYGRLCLVRLCRRRRLLCLSLWARPGPASASQTEFKVSAGWVVVSCACAFASLQCLSNCTNARRLLLLHECQQFVRHCSRANRRRQRGTPSADYESRPSPVCSH